MSFIVGALWRSLVGTEKYVNLAEQRQRKKKLSESGGLGVLGGLMK